jgi:hypothetical protein
MEVVYKVPIQAELNTVITTACLMNKKIDFIKVTGEEWEELIDSLDNIQFYKGRPLTKRADNRLYCKFNDTIVVRWEE